MIGVLAVTALGLAGCGKSPETRPARTPEPIAAGDECHVCGMIIARFPGPKGEAFVRGQKHALKFCSTRDLFTWLLQPETAAVVQEVYVHDMSAGTWAHPDDSAFIDARAAFYVVGSDAMGAMGPTLASFRTEEEAKAFIAKHGGRIARYKDITLKLLSDLDKLSPGHP